MKIRARLIIGTHKYRSVPPDRVRGKYERRDSDEKFRNALFPLKLSGSEEVVMRVHTWMAGVILGVIPGAVILSAQAPASLFLAPKPTSPAGWVAPNKPWTKLSELLAKHTGQTDWTETIVSDDLLHGDYISMGPGKKTPRRMNADTREWWIVQDGQIRFTIDGIEPFVASKGWLVQVPYRNLYQMETVGDRPSLRFEVNVANATKMYPLDETPVPVPGKAFTTVRLQGGKGKYDDLNKP